MFDGFAFPQGGLTTGHFGADTISCISAEALMLTPNSNLRRFAQILIPAGLILISGCMNPGMYYGNPYGQPMYAPPQMINQGAGGNPGSLFIPESSAPAYNPSGSTYDEPGLGDQTDGFDKVDENGDGRYFGAGDDDGGVPFPPDRGSADDLGVQFDGRFDSSQGKARPSSIQPVSSTSAPVEYGFDTENYAWLRGVLGYDNSLRTWFITYSPAARDQFGGNLLLKASPGQLEQFRDGDMIDVQGHVETANSSSDDLPRYHVESIRRVSM